MSLSTRGPHRDALRVELEDAGRAMAGAVTALGESRARARALTIRARRAGWTLEAIAAALGTTRTTVTAWLAEDARGGV